MKVLITYASAGAGHRRAAEAVYDYLKSQGLDLKLELVDILPFVDPFFRFCYARGYPFLVHNAAWLWGFLFWITEFRLTRWFSRAGALVINYFSCRKFIRYLEEKKFDLIISTHFLNSELASNLKLKDKIKSKLITVITDFGVHPFWVSRGTDLYIAASAFTKNKLLQLGVVEQKIQASGIPFSPSFLKVQNRAQLAEKLGINPDSFTVLLMTGSFGSGPLEEIAESLSLQAQVLVVCAGNKKLFFCLQKRNLKNVKIFEFVRNSQELMAVSDVLVTKPGGATITEALIMELPLVFISAIPGQETANCEVLAESGIGVSPRNVKEIKNLILDWKNHPQKILELKQKIKKLQKPFACQELASVVR